MTVCRGESGVCECVLLGVLVFSYLAVVDLWIWGSGAGRLLLLAACSLCLQLLPIAVSFVAQTVTVHTHALSPSRAVFHVQTRTSRAARVRDAAGTSQSPRALLSACLNINEVVPCPVSCRKQASASCDPRRPGSRQRAG